jgi:hypothetical protein
MKRPWFQLLWAVALSCGMVMGAAAPAAAITSPPAGSGYWMLGVDGIVYPFGTAKNCGNAEVFLDLGEIAVDIVPTPNGLGYWTLTNAGFVQFFDCGMPAGDKASYLKGNDVLDLLSDDEEAVSMSALPNGTGYWVFTSRGRVIQLGAAKFYGDMRNVPLNGPVLDSVATPSGKGYYMVASDGGIFAFGDARFAGSMGGQRLNKPVQSMAPDPDGTGYWLVASDGGIFAFGAPFYGSMGSVALNEPVVGMVASPTGHGYLMVALDGGIFAFGDVPFHGSLGSNPPAWPVLSVAVMP